MGDQASYMKFLANDFLMFLRANDGTQEAGLAYALDEWISQGDVIKLTGGDFGVYLQVVIYIMMCVTRSDDDSSLPAIEIDIDFDFGEGVPPDALDRRLWNAQVFERGGRTARR